jgi:hypothetical protein
VGLITKEFGGKAFAVLLSVSGFIAGPLWLGVNSIFCYDGFDQLVLAAFLYVLVRFLRSGNQRLWLLLGGIAGIGVLVKLYWGRAKDTWDSFRRRRTKTDQ